MPKLKKNYTPEDVLKIREQARLRAKKFYDANKEKISLQKKEKWAAIMSVAPAKKSNIIKTQIIEPEILPIDEPFVFVEEEKIDEPAIKMKVKNGKLSIPINQADAIEKINALDATSGTKTKYINDLKTLLNITKCEDIRECLKQSKKIISEIENAKQKRDPTLSYGINTKKSLYQTILFLITNLKIDLKESTIERYKSKFEEYKILSRDKTAENKVSNDDSVMDYKEYVKKILQKFGVKSKQYLVARLYDELTCRDNYGNLEIIENLKEVKPNKNYIVVPRKRITLVLQEFKTDTAFPAVYHKVSDSLDTLIRSYLSENELSYGDTLLGKSLLSSFVGEMNRAIGIENGSINYIRHSKITTELSSSKLSPAERIALAKKSQHSVITQLSYVRKLKDV
jgi:hypothetical protein